MRVLDCECGCEARYVAFQARHTVLWVVLLLWQGTDAEVWREVDMLWNPEAGVDNLPEVVERYLALIGLAWPALSSGEAAADQFVLANAMPGWMLRLRTGTVWRTRRCVFGADLTRVPRALRAIDKAYVKESPVTRTRLA